METQEKKFGFTSFAEIWNGRLAMLAFAIIIGSEISTGQGMLSRIEGMLSHLGII